jgi:hypothetical protein
MYSGHERLLPLHRIRAAGAGGEKTDAARARANQRGSDMRPGVGTASRPPPLGPDCTLPRHSLAFGGIRHQASGYDPAHENHDHQHVDGQ